METCTATGSGQGIPSKFHIQKNRSDDYGARIPASPCRDAELASVYCQQTSLPRHKETASVGRLVAVCRTYLCQPKQRLPSALVERFTS